MESTFDITVEEKTFHFSLDKHGSVWLIDKKKGNTNFGQEKPATTLDEAKEIAKIMLYALGRTRKP